MNVRWVCGTLAALLVFASPNSAQAKEKKSTAAEVPAQKTADQRAQQEKSIREDLNGTVWTIELRTLSGEKSKKPKKDVLSFEESKVRSEMLVKEGYPATNFTLTVSDDKTAPVVWETMQTKEGVGVAFWRGEREGNVMRGILSQRSEKGVVEDFAFSGAFSERKTASESKPDAPPASSEPAPEASSAAPPAVLSTPPAQAVQKEETPTASSPAKKQAVAEEPKKKGWW